MSTKHSPKKVTLAMIKGKPITTSVPVIHYHASDDELAEIYPSTNQEKSEKVLPIPSKGTHESDLSENNSEARSVSSENILLEGTPPSLDPWKVFSDIKGKITKTFEEKLSEIKSDKGKQRYPRGESSSISDIEDAGSATPTKEAVEENKCANEAAATVVRHRGNPAKYITFSGVKTGLKDNSLQDEGVESGIPATEYPEEVNEDVISPTVLPSDNSIYSNVPSVQNSSYSKAFSQRVDLKAMFSRSIRQLIYQSTYKSVIPLIIISCIFYVIPIPDYVLGFAMGVFLTITIYHTVVKFKNILTTLPEERYVSSPTIPILEIPAVEEHAPVERFHGWLNELPYNYEPNNYHVARTKSVFLRLEGHILRIMETRMKVPKRAIWDEPKHKLKFVRRRVYNLIGASVELLPHGLTRRRRWSKKYPICITLRKNALICSAVPKSSITEYMFGQDAIKSTRGGGDVWFSPSVIKQESTLNDGEEEEDEEEEDEEEYTTEAEEEEDEEADEEEDEGDDEEDEDEEEMENTPEDESSNYFWANFDLDNGFVQYEDCFFNCEETEERADTMEGKKQRKRLEEERADGINKKGKEDANGRKIRKKWAIRKAWKKNNENSEEESRTDEKKDKRSESKSKDGKENNEESREGPEMKNDLDEVRNDSREEQLEMSVEGKVQMMDQEDNTLAENNLNGNTAERDKKLLGKVVLQKGGKEDNDAPRGKKRNTFRSSLYKSGRKKEIKIIIFARADREKEDWYRRLVHSISRTQPPVIRFGKVEAKSPFSVCNSHEVVRELSYNAYMSKLLDRDAQLSARESATEKNDRPNLWINCIIARILFDLRKCPETINLIQDKIQRKLSNIKLPYFMECLSVSEIAIGQGAPVIRNVTEPVVNERGLWLDFDITFKGSLTMIVETKLNLMKLTRTGSVSGPAEKYGETCNTEKHELATRSPIFDSDLEDTPETSTEDDYDTTRTQCLNMNKETTSTQSSGKKFLSMVDRITANKYFQHATELSYVRRAMEGVSNTEIRLMVTVSRVEGCLSVNIPPAPSDRLWYGFKPVPKVSLTVKPAVGERMVNIVYVTKWIEAKLLREFEKLVVLPNMDDLVIPLCPNYP